MTDGILVQIATTAVLNGVAALLVASLRKGAQRQDEKLAGLASKLDEIAHELRDLAAKVGNHDASLAAGNQRFTDLERTVRKLEELFRERERDCLTRCRYPPMPPAPEA